MNHRMLCSLALCAATSVATAQSAGVVVDATGTALGLFAGEDGSTIVHSARGYRFAVRADNGTVASPTTDVGGVTYDSALVFTSVNCTGQAYVTVSSAGAVSGGMVLPAGSRGLHSIDKAVQAQVLAMGSSFSGTACTTITPGLFAVVPAHPNNPAVTGVSNTPYAPPIRLELLPLSMLYRVFSDGFESSAVLPAISSDRQA
jgi:hypothetical protein